MRILGDVAERAAARHLKRRGWKVVERNVRIGKDEIDLVCLEERTVVFVEVRYRRAGMESARESVNDDKVQRLRRAALAYRLREKLMHTPFRHDLIVLGRRDGAWIFDLVPILDDDFEGRRNLDHP